LYVNNVLYYSVKDGLLMLMVTFQLLFRRLRLSMEDSSSNNYHRFLLGSFNCRGLINDSKRQYVRSLLNDLDFLFVQEHWASDSQLNEFNTISANHFVTGVQGFDNKKLHRTIRYAQGPAHLLDRRN